jgi:glycerate kinase
MHRKAIQHLLKEVNNATITLALKGQAADSGGGGVLESLGNQLKKRDLCSPTYLVASCTQHMLFK